MPGIKREREDEDEDEDVNEDDEKDDDEVRKEPALVRSLYVELENTQRPKNHVPRTPLIAPCYAVAWSPDCTTLATGGYERLVKLWSVATGGCILSLPGHEGSITCLDFSPDGATLATESADMTIRLWTVSTGVCRTTLLGHEGCECINACAWSPDGAMLAFGGGDETARLWDTATGACMAILWHTPETLRSPGLVGPAVWDVCWGSDGGCIAPCSEKTLKLWDASGRRKATLVQTLMSDY